MNKRHPWTDKELAMAQQLKKGGKSDYEIAAILNRSYMSVNVKLNRTKIADQLIPTSTMPLWDKPLESEGDTVILSDVEAPFQHSDFINRVLDLAYAWGVRNLHLAGDLLHYDNLSAWGSEWTEEQENMRDMLTQILGMVEKKQKETAVKLLEDRGILADTSHSGEMKAAREVFSHFGQFDNVYVELGNHDDRYLRALNKAMSPNELLFQLGKNKDTKWKIAPYYYGLVHTEGGTYRITHPRGAGRSTAQDLAVQFHQHIIMGHSHRWAVNRDVSGKFWAIQTGACVDERRLAYVQQRDAKRDAHLLGATIIRGGYPFVLSPESPWEMLARM